MSPSAFLTVLSSSSLPPLTGCPESPETPPLRSSTRGDYRKTNKQKVSAIQKRLFCHFALGGGVGLVWVTGQILLRLLGRKHSHFIREFFLKPHSPILLNMAGISPGSVSLQDRTGSSVNSSGAGFTEKPCKRMQFRGTGTSFPQWLSLSTELCLSSGILYSERGDRRDTCRK